MYGRAIAAGALGFTLAACNAAPPPPGGPIALCSAQSGLSLRAAKAQAAGAAEPVSATPEEVRQINACLVRAGAGAIEREVTVPVPTPEREGASIFSEGTGYRGSTLVNVTLSPVAADPAPRPAPKPAKGKLPLPTSYPLLPGDAELWATLTREQQERALLFLQDGSTIRASLRTD
ncbi:hypothetical protein [Defluviimonas sp. WL0075]|uniref:Uncharacterized protein n=1 Tax=Albidovulum sediminicola TaxID=2984331 RepID=A0ABT2Z2K9_9RHOB|nr:hypothetical protein [Defluviimonas sp. WL0075]MCV2865325.1 hypothetical protein [Defluviimonas sp. WL0075]